MSAHPHHNMHQHSLEANQAGQEVFSARAMAVLDYVRKHGPSTDRGIMSGLGFSDPNMVRPRISELVKCGALIECDKIKVNGRNVRVVQIETGDYQ